MRRGALLIFIAAAAAVVPARAEPPREAEAIRWPACVRAAWRDNPDLASALAKLGQSKADRRIAASPLFPEVTASSAAERAKGTDGTSGDALALGLDARQLLFDGFKTPFEMGRAGENISASRYAYMVSSSDVRLRLRNAFVDLLSSQQFLGISREIVERRRQNTDLVSLRYEAGREHRGSLMLSQADLARAEFDVAAAVRAIALGQRRLTKEMGLPHTAPLEAAGDFTLGPPGPEMPEFELICQTNPFLQKLAALKEAARWGVKSSEADYFPKVYGNLGVNKLGNGWPARGDEKDIGVTLSWPLFEGGKRVAGVTRSRDVLLQAEADERSGRDGVVLTLTDAWTAVRDAIELAEVQRLNLAAAEERAKISRAQYSIGLLSFDNWTIIEDALVRAKQTYLDALRAEGRAEATWIQAKGGTLEDEVR